MVISFMVRTSFRNASAFSAICLLAAVVPFFAFASGEATLLVNTEAFAIIDDLDAVSDVELRFGESLGKTLSFDRGIQRFVFNDSVYVGGDLDVQGTASGQVVQAVTELRSSGSLVVEDTTTFEDIVYTWPKAAATHSGKLLGVNPASGQLSWTDADIFVRKASNETITSSTTLQDDNDLRVEVAANEVWMLRFYLNGTSGTTPDWRMGLKGQAGSSCVFGVGEFEQSTSGVSTDCDAAPTAITGIIASNQREPMFAWAIYEQGGSAGTVNLQWAQNQSSGQSTTMHANSFLLARRVE